MPGINICSSRGLNLTLKLSLSYPKIIIYRGCSSHGPRGMRAFSMETLCDGRMNFLTDSRCHLVFFIIFIVIIVTCVTNCAIAHEMVVVKEWSFDAGTGGWTSEHSLAKPSAVGGLLKTRVVGFDPYLHSPSLKLDGRTARHIMLRMRSTSGTQLKLYWRTSKSPGWTEAQTAVINIESDGQMHDYSFSIDSPKWSGNILQMRFDLEPPDCETAEWDIDRIAVYRKGPELSADINRDGSAVIELGQDITYTIKVRNTGGESLGKIEANISLPAHLRLLSGDVTKRIDAIEPGDSLEWALKAKALANGDGKLMVRIDSDKVASLAYSSQLVSKRIKHTSFSPGYRQFEDGASLANLSIGMRFVRPTPKSSITHFTIHKREWSSGDWTDLATSSPMSLLTYTTGETSTESYSIALTPTTITNNDDGKGVVLSGNYTDEDGGLWSMRMEFRLESNQIEVRYEIKCDKDRRILQWSGPMLQAGESGFGLKKADALFPGLEWLTSGEVSSNELDIAPPGNLRCAPHPLKVTIPVMGVSDGKSVVGIAWDAKQKWDGERSMPVARFYSPNWLNNQANHLMALSIPSIPEHTAENTEFAHKPYPLAAGHTLAIQATLFARDGNSSLTAIDEWFQAYGIPGLQKPPRSYDDQIALSRQAYLSSVWHDGKGFAHCVGWDASPSPAHAHLLLLDRRYSAGLSKAAKSEMDNRIDWTIEECGYGGLASGAGSHLYGWELPFLVGGVIESLQSLQPYIAGLLDSQRDDGSWAFEPVKPEQETLGQPGAVESGLILTPASQLMRWARITGDPTAAQAALKALDIARKYRIPRAAQVWECPVHSPDILSAARGVQAYLDAYITTGDTRYLADAVYWAKAGLPFIYMWGTPSLPVMDFSTIPIFGATFYTLSWIGRPVQWNGLVYAYWLFQLARYDNSFSWKRIAEGITRSGMHQTSLTGPTKGTYPDSWVLDGDSPQGPYINPEDVVKNVWVLKGINPELRTIVVKPRRESKPGISRNIHITAPVDVTFPSLSSEVLKFSLASKSDGHTIHCLVTGLPSPERISCNNKVLAKGKHWQYDEVDGWLSLELPSISNATVAIRYSGR